MAEDRRFPYRWGTRPMRQVGTPKALSDESVGQIKRELLDKGHSPELACELALRYGVSARTIRAIGNGERYFNVPPADPKEGSEFG